MLTVSGGGTYRDCQRLWRRDFLKAGALGLGSLTLSWLLRQRAQAAAQGYVRDRSVVFLFLAGGASHIETFNPNMDAPAPYRSVTGEVQTVLPGVTFGGNFPHLARLADRMAVVRSFRHGVGDHGSAIVHVLSGGTRSSEKEGRGFSLGSATAKVRGANDRRTGMPTYALLTAPETDNQYRTEKNRVVAGSSPGVLGPAFAPFDPAGGSQALKNMQLSISPQRLHDRRSLRHALDRVRRQFDHDPAVADLDRFEQQAVDLLLHGASDAFDLSREDRRTRQRYDTSMYRVGNKAQRPKLVRSCTLGDQMLLARRLCEAGCGFVTVQNAGWDNHADGNNPGIVDGVNMLGPPLDKAVSAFLEDLEQRGLSDKILLVISGDFGRTPKINQRGGRDHWAPLGTLAFAGGGLRMGQVIGQAARNNDVPATDPISTPNLMATVMHALFDIGQLRLVSGLPVDVKRAIETAEPIHELF